MSRLNRTECSITEDSGGAVGSNGTGRYFPLFISLKDKRFLLVGAGTIAARRAGVLIRFDAGVTVLAPACCAQVRELEGTGRIRCIEDSYDAAYLEGADFVLAMTDDAAVNDRVVRDCRRRGLPVNNASDQNQCDFFFPAILEKDELTIGVTSSGRNPAFVKRFCRKLRELLETMEAI